jgi:hypothetical protein
MMAAWAPRQLGEDTCLALDVAFVTNQQLEHADPDKWIRGAPALAVEIFSLFFEDLG